jgi:hypothetical protein
MPNAEFPQNIIQENLLQYVISVIVIIKCKNCKRRIFCPHNPIWKVLKCGAGQEWRRSVGPIV